MANDWKRTDRILQCMGFYQSIRDVCIGEHWNIGVPRGQEDNEAYQTLAGNLRELVSGINKTIIDKGLDLCYSRAMGEIMAMAFTNQVKHHLQPEAVRRHMDAQFEGYLQSLEAFTQIIDSQDLDLQVREIE